MPFLRSHPRTTDTRDLSARLRSSGRRWASARVLNLSEGGMLVTGSELEIGEIASFEIAGPDFRSAGVVEVTHRTDEVTGLRIVRWDAPSTRNMRSLIRGRIGRERQKSGAHSVPGRYLG
jgi:hypothetical protein